MNHQDAKIGLSPFFWALSASWRLKVLLLRLRFSKDGLFNLNGNREKHKAAGGKKIVFTGFIDNAHVVVAFSIGIRQDWIYLATLERQFVVAIINAYSDPMY